MVETSDEPSLLDRIRSSARKIYASCTRSGAGGRRPALPLTDESVHAGGNIQNENGVTANDTLGNAFNASITAGSSVADKTSPALPPSASPPDESEDQELSATIDSQKKPSAAIRFYSTIKDILFSSMLNILLIFVPIGIGMEIAGANPIIIFTMNAIAIIPLAGLLSYATESVAGELGDTIGALMNVTFGNAVELIILWVLYPLRLDVFTNGVQACTCNSIAFNVICPLLQFVPLGSGFLSVLHAYLCLIIDCSIALVKNEIRIVQASLLGSILANLLLILGMCFLLGGLRFREQIYNSTVTQMSACLLSLSVMSLLLPTAFHASFTDNEIADKAVLRVSRGTSIILLLVYVLYLLFQLKSHAYMYQSTPQHVIDEESHPGVLAEMLGSATSSDSSSSSNDSDSDTARSSGSNTTAKRIKRVLRGRRRRKSSASSKDAPSVPLTARTSSVGTFSNTFDRSDTLVTEARNDKATVNVPSFLGAIASGDEADTDGEREDRSIATRPATINFRDFENQRHASGSKSPRVKPKKKRSKQKAHKSDSQAGERTELSEKSPMSMVPEINVMDDRPLSRHIEFVENGQVQPESSPKRPFNLRGLSVRGTMPAMPALPMPTIPRMLSSTVFSATNPTGLPTNGPSVVSQSLRRTKSLTDLDQRESGLPTQLPSQTMCTDPSNHSISSTDSEKPKRLSRTIAIVVLLVSTGLVAVCAEFLVGSINYLVENTSVSEAFVGLIILPIIGNAAEHVTAVTVAAKNKMDLAIGVAVGSSIQIAIFVTPVIVLLGWILAKDMSLYFNLFETISLFVSAFIVNFLVLDGRSNYLEGALLIAAYVIIALAAFFYPSSAQQSPIGGAEGLPNALRMV